MSNFELQENQGFSIKQALQKIKEIKKSNLEKLINKPIDKDISYRLYSLNFRFLSIVDNIKTGKNYKLSTKLTLASHDKYLIRGDYLIAHKMKDIKYPLGLYLNNDKHHRIATARDIIKNINKTMKILKSAE